MADPSFFTLCSLIGYAYERYDGVEMKVMTDIRSASDHVSQLIAQDCQYKDGSL